MAFPRPIAGPADVDRPSEGAVQGGCQASRAAEGLFHPFPAPHDGDHDGSQGSEPYQDQDVAQAQVGQFDGAVFRTGQVFGYREEDGGDFRGYTLGGACL